MLQWFLFLFVFLQEISLERILGNPLMVAGFPFATWVLYAFYMGVLLMTLKYIIFQRDKRTFALSTLAFVCCVIIVTINSMFYDRSFFQMLSNSVHYVIPVLIYTYVYGMKNRMKFYRSFTILVVIAGILSAMFMFGTLSGFGFLNITLIGALTRSSLLVDGGLGIIAYCVGIYSITYKNDKITTRNAVLLTVFGLLIVIASQSRARILTVIICTIFFLLEIELGRGKQEHMWLKTVGGILVLLLVVITIFPEQFNTIQTQILGRFSEMGTDNSSIYRRYEFAQQMELFRSSPIVGVGWNGMNDVKVVDTYGTAQTINNHNMYSTILAMGGIVLAIGYIYWFGNLIVAECSKYRQDNEAKLHNIILLAIAIMSVSSAGFSKTSMVIGMIIIYVNITERNDRRRSIGYETDRYPNVS